MRRTKQVQVSVNHELAATFDQCENISAFVRECTGAYLRDYEEARQLVHGALSAKNRLKLVELFQHHVWTLHTNPRALQAVIGLADKELGDVMFGLLYSGEEESNEMADAIKCYVRAFWGAYVPARTIV